MNILNVTQSHYPLQGGVSRSIYNNKTYFEAMGHTVYTICPTMEGSKPENNVFRIASIDLQHSSKNTPPLSLFIDKIPSISKALLKVSGVYHKLPVSFYDEIERKIRRIRFDVIHAHICFSMGEFAYRLSLKRNIPIIYTVHTAYNEVINKVVKTRLDIEKVTTLFANKVDGVIFPTNHIREIYKSKNFDNYSVVIPSGIHTKSFLQSHASVFTMGTLCRLDTEKNIEVVYSVAATILKKYSETRFLICGDGNMLKPGIEFFKKVGVYDRCMFQGNVDSAMVSQMYSRMSCFLYASHSETQGIVISEAQAAGLMVISLSDPVINEVLNGTGMVCESISEMCNAVIKVKNNGISDTQRQNIIKNAQNFDISRCAQRHINFYKEFL